MAKKKRRKKEAKSSCGGKNPSDLPKRRKKPVEQKSATSSEFCEIQN